MDWGNASHWIPAGIGAGVLILTAVLPGKPRRWLRGILRAFLAAIVVSLLAAALGLLVLDLPIRLRAFVKNEDYLPTHFWAYSGLAGLILTVVQQAVAAWNARRRSDRS